MTNLRNAQELNLLEILLERNEEGNFILVRQQYERVGESPIELFLFNSTDEIKIWVLEEYGDEDYSFREICEDLEDGGDHIQLYKPQ